MAEYIDRDKLIRHLEDDFEACGEPDSSIRPIAYGTILGLRGALSYARTLPEADVVEVRHARWEIVKGSNGKEKWYVLIADTNRIYTALLHIARIVVQNRMAMTLMSRPRTKGVIHNG